MKHLRPIVTVSLFIASTLFVSLNTSAQAKTYFRYLNDKGVKVISDSISPQYVVKGYEIIGSSGRVIQVVAPEPSTEEKIRLAEEKAEKERLAKWDKRLLLRYSHVDDINAAKERKLRNIDNDIFNLQLTVGNINEEIKEYQAKAANSERRGKAIAEDTLQAMNRLQKDKALTNDQINRKQDEKQQVAEHFDKDIERFKIIRPDIAPATIKTLNTTTP